MVKKRSLLKTIRLYMILISSASILVIGHFWISGVSKQYKKDIEQLYSGYISSQKELIKNETLKAVDYLEYFRNQVDELLRNDIKSRTYEAYNIALHLYENYRETRSVSEIKNIIIESLKPIRFNNNRGYYFVEDFTEPNTAIALVLPGKEGTNRFNAIDLNGKYYIREMVDLVKTEGEGFITYYRNLPGEDDNPQPKISFVKLFEPYNWFIGTGEYLNNVEQEIKQEVLNRLSKISFGPEGYVFVYDNLGNQLLSDLKVNEEVINLWDYEDGDGNKIIRQLKETSEKPGGGYIQYRWKKISDSELSNKISYVMGIPEWNWFIGAGVYLDEIDATISAKSAELKKLQNRHLIKTVALLISALILILLVSKFYSEQVLKHFNSFTSFFNQASIGNDTISLHELNYIEFDTLAQSANRMIGDIRNYQNELVREKNKAQNYLDVAGVILLVINNQENVVLINKKGCETIGLPAEKIIGLNWFDNFLPEEIRETVRHDFHQILRNKLSQHKFYESEIITSNNLRKTILWQNTVLTDDEGQITGTLSSGEDITQNKLAEFKLMESERRLKKIIESNPDGIIFLAHDNSILYVNKMAEKMFHKPQDELLGTSFQYPYSLDKFSELEIIRSNEPNLTVEMNFIETEWAGEKAYLGTFRDITDKIQTTRELKVQKAYLEELFEGAPAAVVVLDNKDRVLKVNRKFTSLFGYGISEARGKMINDLLVPDNLKEEGINSTMTVARGNNVDLETIRKTKDGKLINVSVIGRPIRLEHDQIAVYALYEDITERKRAENALRTSEEKYRNLVEFIEEGIVMIDGQEKFIFANQAAARIFGFDHKNELIGKNLSNFVPEKIYADLSRKTFIQKKGEITRFEFPITTVTGKYRYLNITANPMFIDGEYQYTFGIFNDLTARIEYEKELQNTKDFLEKIMESVNNGVFTLNLNGEFTLVNKALTEITGYSYSELIHKPISDFVSPQTVKILTLIITDIIQRGKIFINQEISLTTKSGESVILKFNFAPMIEDGKIFSVVGSLENITKQKKAETALRESELRFRKLFKSSPDAILLADLKNFLIVDANPATENLIGKRLEDIIGMDMIEMFPPRLRNHSEINLLNYLTGRESTKEPKFKIYLQNSGGFEIPIEITATEVQIKGENYLLANIRDETVRTNAENKIISQGEQLKLINKILRHDLSNNLTSIHSGIKLYHKTEQDIFLNEATKNVNKSIELIREMKEFEIFMAEHENLKIVDLKDVFTELQVNYPDKLIFTHDQVKVLADETIRSIFNNLISNAVKHGKADKIKITTQKDKKICTITVENNGKKIPVNITDKIFEEGFKYGKTGNTGLGLYIVRSAMKRFGGEVRLGTNQSGKVEFILELKTV